ncbi:hypothetical protein PAXRUDRAFT_441485, partial [Paxillus rubicundulus Ve08.2h10]
EFHCSTLNLSIRCVPLRLRGTYEHANVLQGDVRSIERNQNPSTILQCVT